MSVSESRGEVRSEIDIALLEGEAADGVLGDLAEVLVDCVDGGASVGFEAPLPVETAREWWRKTMQDSSALTWIASSAGRVVGVVRLLPSGYPNGRHRAEVAKLLVHRDARGRGVATSLMHHLETGAIERGRWLLILDTQTGSPAERLYEKWGWQRLGVLEDHAYSPDGRLAPTTFMSKRLAGS
ncbi:MAG: GNAT family N-acetyltransferase [Mycobacteriales bacterium]